MVLVHLANIKATFKAPQRSFEYIVDACLKKSAEYKNHSNFSVIRFKSDSSTKTVYSVFKAKQLSDTYQYWNVTGIKSFDDLTKIKSQLEFLLNCNSDCILGPFIDNISAKGKLKQRFPINENTKNSLEDFGLQVRSNRETFTGCCIQRKNSEVRRSLLRKLKKKKSAQHQVEVEQQLYCLGLHKPEFSGCLRLYPSGHFLIVGSKSLEDCQRFINLIESINH